MLHLATSLGFYVEILGPNGTEYNSPVKTDRIWTTEVIPPDSVLGDTSRWIVSYYIMYPLKVQDPYELAIPVMYPDLPALSAKEGTFKGTIKFCNPEMVLEAFPTNTWTIMPYVDKQTQEQCREHVLSLQAIPSVIRLTIGSEKPWFSTLGLVDLFIALILIGLLTMGWKQIRKV